MLMFAPASPTHVFMFLRVREREVPLDSLLLRLVARGRHLGRSVAAHVVCGELLLAAGSIAAKVG